MVHALLRYLGGRFWSTSAIVLLAAVMEGLGLVLLAPLLAAATGETDNRWWRMGQDLLERIGIDSLDGRILAIVGGFVALLLLRAAVLRLRDVRLARHNLGFADHMAVELVGALAHAPWQRLPANTRSEMEHAVHADVRRVQAGSLHVLRAGASLALALAQVAAAILISWRLALVSLAALALVALPVLPRVLAVRRIGHEATLKGRAVHETLARFLSGLKLFKAHGREDTLLEECRRSLHAMRARSLAYAEAQADVLFLTQAGAGIVVAGIALAGLLWLDLPIAVLGLFVVIFARMAQQVFAMVQSAQFYLHVVPAFNNLVALKAAMPTAEPIGQSTAGLPGAGPGPMALAMERADYAIPPAGPDILRGATFAICPGEIVALVGPSGSGKTTLLDLIVGLAAPQAGRIVIDGQAVESEWPTDLREAIAYVPQEPMFFDGDLGRNLRALAPDASDAEIAAAFRLSEAETIPAIEAQGLEARMGEGGQAFSGGERQRISLARALLRRPRLLILDEALSALDREREARILDRLAALTDRMTILMVTHRLPEAVRIDRILHLEGGTLREVAREDTGAIA
ncbi:Protein glycosylation K [Alteriqipengyuania sp. 357]